MIEFEFLDIEIPELKPEFFVSSIKDLIKTEKKLVGDITVVFCSDAHLLQMNIDYLEHDYYTDIITFDYTKLNIISGDLFISYDRVVDNASTFSVSTYNELCRVVFHGVLHLCGYKDKSEEDEKLMRKKEAFYLDKYVSRETLS
ncbi:MAG: rRNA maturation RNase YbeY [Flavobacteriales bacterium]|nr:rRNA maturation RNase YbeY [Crocinitomicaceae bacterium]NBX79373.1 rRNA maturation RNase YbeY [Flavobacteriales bacterium]NCA19584.1 rRNA maturation RNase YbeY [Crocinitomicaceae bacterium]